MVLLDATNAVPNSEMFEDGNDQNDSIQLFQSIAGLCWSVGVCPVYFAGFYIWVSKRDEGLLWGLSAEQTYQLETGSLLVFVALHVGDGIYSQVLRTLFSNPDLVGVHLEGLFDQTVAMIMVILECCTVRNYYKATIVLPLPLPLPLIVQCSPGYHIPLGCHLHQVHQGTHLENAVH